MPFILKILTYLFDKEIQNMNHINKLVLINYIKNNSNIFLFLHFITFFSIYFNYH